MARAMVRRLCLLQPAYHAVILTASVVSLATNLLSSWLASPNESRGPVAAALLLWAAWHYMPVILEVGQLWEAAARAPSPSAFVVDEVNRWAEQRVAAVARAAVGCVLLVSASLVIAWAHAPPADPQLLANALLTGFALALAALAVALPYAPTRTFNFALGALFTVGAYVAWASGSMTVGVVAAAGLGMAMELGVYRPLRRRGSRPLVLLLASLGLYTVLQNLISLIWGDATQTLRSGPVREGLLVWGARVTPVQLGSAAVSLLMVALVGWLLGRTSFGRVYRAVASDTDLARCDGLDTERVVLVATALGSGLAGLCGVRVALDVDMTPTMGLNLLMMGVVAMIVGGSRRVGGLLAGGLLLGLAQHLGAWYVGSQWQESIAFVVLVVFLLARPGGFSGQASGPARV